MPVELTQRYDDAVRYARTHHAADLRKGTAIPYLAHLLAVSALTLEMEASEDEAIAALLHDVIEDHGGPAAELDIRERFGAEVARIVRACSDTDEDPKPPWEVRKRAYIDSIATKAPDELRVSLADKLHNSRAILMDLREHGDALWGRFKTGRDGQLWYYGALVDAFEARMDDIGEHAQPAVRELARTVQLIRETA